MKVFLSWSGSISHKVACALREWLPSVIQSVVPYVSSEDIDKGSRWSTDIAKELEDSRYGIICVTKENIGAPWVNFEAGALSKIIDKSFVTPLLFDLKRSDVQGPLLQFQSTVVEKEDIHKLLQSINNRALETERLKDDKLRKAFDVWWPQLEQALKAVKATDDEQSKSPAKGKDKTSEILEEVLELVRGQQRLLHSPEAILPIEYLNFAFDKARIRKDRPPIDNELLRPIHRAILELEEFLRRYLSEHPDASEAMGLVERIHNLFHRLPEWDDVEREFIRRRARHLPKVDKP